MEFSRLFSSTTSSSPATDPVIGNGVMCHNGGQRIGRPLIAVGPMIIDSPDGVDGPPTFRLDPCLGTLTGANGNSTADQGFAVKGAARYLVREVVFHNPSAAADIMAGGLYTYPNKGGRALIPATQMFGALDPADPRKMLRVPVLTPYLLEAPVLFLSLTTAQGAALTFDMAVIGDVVERPTT